MNILKQIKATGRTFYGDEQIAESAPVNKGKLGKVEFFKLDRYVSDDELEKEYEARGMVPASLQDLIKCEKEIGNKYIVTHWKKDGEWCFAAFGGWGGGRRVRVSRDNRDWDDGWLFGGRSKLGTKSLEAKSLEERLTELESKMEKIQKFLII